MLNLGLNETVDQLTMASIVYWYGYVWRKGDHVMRWAFDLEFECQRNKEWLKGTWRRQVEEEGWKDGLSRDEFTLPINVEC